MRWGATLCFLHPLAPQVLGGQLRIPDVLCLEKLTGAQRQSNCIARALKYVSTYPTKSKIYVLIHLEYVWFFGQPAATVEFV